MAASDHFEKRILRARLCGLDRIQGSGSLCSVRTETLARAGKVSRSHFLWLHFPAPLPCPLRPAVSASPTPESSAPALYPRSLTVGQCPSARPSVHACAAALTHSPRVHLCRSAQRSQARFLSPGRRTTCPPRPGALGL